MNGVVTARPDGRTVGSLGRRVLWGGTRRSVGSLGRRALWRGTLAASGGLRVDGTLPGRPCVIVANHSSHADTAALLAALPARRRPAVAAAADYWFAGTGPRRMIGQHLAAAFPVRRSGGGSADLSAARELLATGHDVIVFPEGTRSRHGEIAAFHTGAARLAEAAGVPLVPIGISGTGELLPVHGRPHRARVTVRIGTPAVRTDDARTAVAALARPAGAHRRVVEIADSRARRAVARLAHSRAGLVVVAAWAVAEALCWPLIPEFALAVLAVAAPRRAPKLALTAAIGSIAGGVIMYTLAAHGFTPPAPLTTPRMHATVTGQFATEGAAAVAHQPLSGIPYKVYGAAAGHAHVGLRPFLAASIPARGARIVASGLLLGAAGALAHRLRRLYALYLVGFATLFTAALAGVVTSWS
jgi:1-acyl-sn-glycerol-3-phosphate acyltransferase